MTEIKNYFNFLWKTHGEASKVITQSLKKLDILTTIPCDTFTWHQDCHIWPVINETG